METSKPKTPFLNVELEPAIWKASGDEAVAWWNLDLEHRLFAEGGAYHGVEHGEVFLYEKESGREKVVNLSVDAGGEGGESTYSFHFSNKGFETLFNMGKGGEKNGNEVKALKIACELLFHLPDGELRAELLSEAMAALEEKRKAHKKTVWDKV